MEALLAQVSVNWIMISLIYALVALGFTLIYSVMGVLNFAHGVLFMLGGYTLFYFVVQFGLGYPLAMVMAFVLPGLFGLAIYKGLLRPFRENLLICLVITIGVANLVESGAYMGFGPWEKSVPSLVSGVIRLGTASLSIERLLVMAVALALVLALIYFVNRTRHGRTLRAVAQDIDAATLQGISAERTFALGMFLASGLGGIAGALMSPLFGIGPFMGGTPLLDAVIICIVGGLGSIAGAVAASFVLGLAASFGGTFLSGEVASLLGFAAVVVIILVRPRGLFAGEVRVH